MRLTPSVFRLAASLPLAFGLQPPCPLPQLRAKVRRVGRFIFATSVGVWLGTVVSFSFVFLPTIHDSLARGAAHELLERMFPRYHLIGIVCGLIALAAVSLAPPSPTLSYEDRLRLAFPVVVSLLCTVATRQWLLPRLATERATGTEDSFARWHRLSVQLNTTILAMLVLAMAAVNSRQ